MSYDKNEANKIYEGLNGMSKQEIVVKMYVQSFDHEAIATATCLTLNQVKEQILHVRSGELIKSFEIASKMLMNRLDVELITNCTGLQKDVVEELRKEMSKKGEI